MQSTFLEALARPRPGLNYLLPEPWCKQFSAINRAATRKQDLILPELNLIPYVDRFLLDYQTHLREDLEIKCNYLQINALKINLEISTQTEWLAVNPEFWKLIDRSHRQTHPLLTFVTDPPSSLKRTQQLQIIYCSKNRTDAFVGYLPLTANLIAIVREIGFEMGHVEVSKSKIVFLERSPQVSFTFHELEKYTVTDAPGLLLMAFNMERKTEEDESLPPAVQIDSNTTLNLSNQAVVGDLNTMEDDNNSRLNERIRDRTISTGAETPFSFALSNGFDLDHQYRVNELFGAKQPEQIEEMKQLASHRINSPQQLISLPLDSEQFYTRYLEKLAEETLEGLAKRKSHKEKQIEERCE